MKFSEFHYIRPNPEMVKAELGELTEKLKNASSYTGHA